MVRKKVGKYLPLIIGALVIIVAVLLLSTRNGVLKVTVIKAEVRTISKTISASGSTSVPENLTARALVAGSVKKINFKGGDTVKKDDVILELDPASLKSSLDTAYSAYLSAKADVQSYDQKVKAAEATESIRKRERDEAWREYMADNGETNKQAYKNAEALYQTALSSLKTLQDDTKATQSAVSSTYSGYYSALNNYQNSKVSSPADGQLALTNVYQGSYVTAGQELFSVTNNTSMVFKAEIDEADVGYIQPGMRAKLSLDSYPEKTFTGSVQNIDAKVVVLTNGSTAVMSDVSFDDAKIMPIKGLSGSADIEIAETDNTLSITSECLLDETDKNFVYIVNQGKVYKKQVEVGFEGDEFVGITSGLNDGDIVIVDPGSYKLTDGQKVKYQP